jgi:hypothetical protein
MILINWPPKRISRISARSRFIVQSCTKTTPTVAVGLVARVHIVRVLIVRGLIARVLIARVLIVRVLIARVLIARVLIAIGLIARVLIERVIIDRVLAIGGFLHVHGTDEVTIYSSRRSKVGHSTTSRGLNSSSVGNANSGSDCDSAQDLLKHTILGGSSGGSSE